MEGDPKLYRLFEKDLLMFLPVFILLELASHGKHGTINAFVMWTGPSTKHLVEVAATQIQH